VLQEDKFKVMKLAKSDLVKLQTGEFKVILWRWVLFCANCGCNF